MTAAPVPIEVALSDPRLLGARFRNAASWRTWFAVLKASYGRPLTKAERAAFDQVAGGRSPPRRKVKELICVVSRRGGKGSIAGAVAAYEATLVHHDLAPGERGVIACVSATKEQAAIVREYCAGFFQASPILRREIVDATADELRLRKSVVSTLAADYRSLRGRTLLTAILDEAAFLADDLECARALLPGLATTGGMLIVLSSPYRRSGLLFERHRAAYVSNGFGGAPKPMAGETVNQFRLRLMRGLQKLSQRYKEADLKLIGDARALSEIETQIFADAERAAFDPTVIGPRLHTVTKRSDGGHTIHTFFGDPRAWLDMFSGRRQLVTAINAKADPNALTRRLA